MRNSTHQATQYLEISGPNASAEIEVAISFTFVPGCPEQGPSYASGGEPAEPASVEDIEFEAFEVVKDMHGGWMRGPKIEMSPWLESFIDKAIDESELLAEVDQYDEVF